MAATTKITVSPPSAGGSYGSRNEKAPFSRSLQVSEEEEGVGSEAGTQSASLEETSHKKEKLMVNDNACELLADFSYIRF